MMQKARWIRIRTLFDRLADAPEPGRSAQLAAHCADDAELRAAVESLFKHDMERGDPLLDAVGAAAESLLEDHRDRLIGAQVGPYRVVSILGHGGMSTVYRGERDDPRYRQTVAIKVLQNAVLHPRLRSRLHSERHILATLDHPSIARLIDSGELDDATPYLVMEYVDGQSIDAYCDNRALIVRERIELFIEVCAAVHYAHRNLVVHRDIKAGNILVSDEGAPKLLDFGVAKLLAPESLSHTLPVTRLQERILTPENAAPEQVLGRPITTATDIYALGVLLYQLLCGRSPYRLLSYSQLQLERAICMDDPTRPSQMVVSKLHGESEGDRSRSSARRGLSPQRLQSLLSGDLDAIIAMAMRKEPDRRYPSVEAFADDLRRHLHGEPVRARQGDWRYSAGKFLRRHVLAACVTAAMFMGLLVIAGVTLWQNHRIGLARDAAAQQRDRAQQVSSFLVDVFSQADPYNAQGKEPTAKDLLDAGADKISANANLQPEVRAQLLESIALAYRHQGRTERAIKLLEQAVSIRRDERPINNRNVAAALSNLARALTDGGFFASAEGYLQEAMELVQAEAPNSREAADILVQFGHFALNAKSDAARAHELFTRALGVYRALPGDQNLPIAAALSALSATAIWSGDFAVGEQYQRDALAIFRATVSRNHPDHAVALANLGYILTQRGKYAEAEQTLTEALEIERNVFGSDDLGVASIEKDLGTLYGREGDLRRALQSTEDALRIATSRLGASSYMRGYYLDSLAHLQLMANDVNGAQADAEEALRIYDTTLAKRHLYVASTHYLLGEILLRKGMLAEAEAHLRTAVGIDAALAGEDNWQTARSQASLGWTLTQQGKDAEGEPLLAAALSRLQATVGAQHPETQQATSRLVQYYREHRRDADAAHVLLLSEKR